MAAPTITVAPPRRDPRLGGLLTVAEVRDEARLAASFGVQYVAEPCNFEFNETGFCYGDVLPDPDEDKAANYQGIESTEGIGPNFASYYGVQCFINDDSDVERRAREAYELAEGRHVEAKFAEWLNAATPIVATPANVTAAIAAADDYADKNYIARPIIHLSRLQAVLAVAAQGLFSDQQGNLWTANGTPAVASGAYGNDVWVTGAVTVLRSPMIVTRAHTLEVNTEEAVAERVFGIIVDCDFVGRLDFTA